MAAFRGHNEVVKCLETHGANRLSKPEFHGDPHKLITRTVKRESTRLLPTTESAVKGTGDGTSAFASSGSELPATASVEDTFDSGRVVRLPSTGRPVFTVESFIGAGKYGEVYVAHAFAQGGQRRAMKRVRFDKSKGERKSLAEIDLCREALLMLELGAHSSIVSLHYFVVSSDGDSLIFFTLVDGSRDLAKLIASGDLYDGTTRDVRTRLTSILQQLAEAVAFCHSRGVIHQDIKPSNILVDGLWNALLADFGLAAVGEVKDAAALRAPFRGCSEAYASPEARELLQTKSSRRISPAETDIWSFGAVALNMSCGDRFPTAEAGIRVILQQIQSVGTNDESSLTVRLKKSRPNFLDLRPNFLKTELPSLNGCERAKVRQILLALERKMIDLIERCLSIAVEDRPTCGSELFEGIDRHDAESPLELERDDKEVSEALLNVGRALVDIRDGDLASKALQGAAERSARVGAETLLAPVERSAGVGAEALALLATVQFRAGKYKEAIASCEKALEYDSTHAGALFTRAECHH